MDDSHASQHELTFRMQMRDWAATQVPRHVFSRLPRVLCRLPERGETLSLTFDDGPHPEGTPALLDVLAKYNAPATFFLLGERVRRWPELVKRILDAGHAIGNHSWSHADFWKCSKTHLLTELTRCQRTLEDLAGEPVRWVRPPYGHVTYTVRAWAKRKDVRVVLWDLLPPDYSPVPDVKRLQRIYKRFVRSGSIICLHDNNNSLRVTPELLDSIIPQAQASGRTFVPLSVPSDGS
ncbi:polysaccharide deacetylase family protein [Planctomicrobium piriforme]|uniref:Peptidoglycan/xylan/chitin deacetylase, PgdA/CDA1 family n=1 Tax=Planctomicrobium piriforme TaxID=1576369 RepID=A0A1I3IFK7_9PLAN|nr:polysaccharide deacetylase family protein [Planctomicrobium piriforme]SFI46716.1 Peptidoglycan/xylan/chitin deacetylase, PgdA/CDA1 family [Planctomicrobium piriforme]